MTRVAAFNAALEERVIAAEVEAGWSFPGAVRPLSPGEVAGKVRFSEVAADVDRITTETQAELVEHIAALDAAIVTELADRAPTLAGLAAALVALRAESTWVDGVLAGLAGAVAAAVTAARAAGQAQMVAEATRQGLPALTDLVVDHEYSTTAAGIVSNQVLAGRLAVAEDTLGPWLAGADAPTDAALDALRAVDPATAQVRIAADTHITAGMNLGRADAAVAQAAVPGRVYASELLDGRTCGPCAVVDGTEYQTLGDALQDYPGGGGYHACEGRGRCRGTLVVVWADEAAATM